MGRPGFKTCERRALASSGLHGGSPVTCGRCSAAEVVSGCGLWGWVMQREPLLMLHVI